MENPVLSIRNFSFKYPNSKKLVLDNINLEIEKSSITCISGLSGSGKTTLLRHLKPVLAPFGEISGDIFFNNKNINQLTFREESEKIGYVQQRPENQVVTDKVWHELAFGLESLGYSTKEIRLKVGEMASFFGIEDWYFKKVSDLSGGQTQILNLASIMVMQPDILILDEPTSQLDPIACGNFVNVLKKINSDLGTTILISEHRLEEILPYSNKLVIIENGKIIYDNKPKNLGDFFEKNNNKILDSMPLPIQVYSKYKYGTCPLNIKEGRKYIENLTNTKNIKSLEKINKQNPKDKTLNVQELYFRYKKESEDVLKSIDFHINKGEIYTILGGNGAGKSTLLKLLSSIEKPNRGKINYKNKNEKISLLPQNPQTLFVKNTVRKDLEEMVEKNENIGEVENVIDFLFLRDLLDSHPYDISGGEQQRLALGKVLLGNPNIILMDEPTKGMDGYFKNIFKDILFKLKAKGITIIMVSHDIEFSGEVSDRCALLFNGEIISQGDKNEFFNGNYFYSTSANKMTRGYIENIINKEDIFKVLEKRWSMENIEKINDKEEKLLQIMRELKFGEIKIIIQDGVPIRIEEVRKSIKL